MCLLASRRMKTSRSTAAPSPGCTATATPKVKKGTDAALQFRLQERSRYGDQPLPIPVHLIDFTRRQLDSVASTVSERLQQLGAGHTAEEAWTSLQRDRAGGQNAGAPASLSSAGASSVRDMGGSIIAGPVLCCACDISVVVVLCPVLSLVLSRVRVLIDHTSLVGPDFGCPVSEPFTCIGAAPVCRGSKTQPRH